MTTENTYKHPLELKSEIFESLLLDKKIIGGIEKLFTVVGAFDRSIISEGTDFFFHYYQLLDKPLPSRYDEVMSTILHDVFFGTLVLIEKDFLHQIQALANNIELLTNSEAEEKGLVFSLIEHIIDNYELLCSEVSNIKSLALKDARSLLDYLVNHPKDLSVWIQDVCSKHLAFDSTLFQEKDLRWFIDHHLHALQLIENKIFEEFTK